MSAAAPSSIRTGPSSMADDEESMRGSNFEDNSSDDDSDEFVDAFDTIEPGMVTPKRRSSVAVPYNGPRPSRRGSLSASVFNLKDGLKKDDEEESESSEKPQPRTESFPSRNRTVESKAAPDDSESTKKNPNLSRQPTKPSDSDERDANLRQDLHKATEKLSKLKFENPPTQAPPASQDPKASQPQAAAEQEATKPLKFGEGPKPSWEIESEKARKKKLREDLKKCPWGAAWALGGTEPIGFVDPNASGYFGLPEANRSSVLFPTGEVLTEEEIAVREQRKKDDQELKADLSATQYHRDMIFAAAKRSVRAKAKKDKGKVILPPVNLPPPLATIENKHREEHKPVTSNEQKPVQIAEAKPTPPTLPPVSTTRTLPVPQRTPAGPSAVPFIKPGGRFMSNYGSRTASVNTTRPVETVPKLPEPAKPERLISFAETTVSEAELPVASIAVEKKTEPKNVQHAVPTSFVGRKEEATAPSSLPAPVAPAPFKEFVPSFKQPSPVEEILPAPSKEFAPSSKQPSPVQDISVVDKFAPANNLKKPVSFKEFIPASKQPSPVQEISVVDKFVPANKKPAPFTEFVPSFKQPSPVQEFSVVDKFAPQAANNHIAVVQPFRRPGPENVETLLPEIFNRRKLAAMSVPSPLDQFCTRNGSSIDDNLLKHFAIVKSAGKNFKETDLYRVAPPEEYVPTYEEALVDGPLPVVGSRTLKFTNLPAGYSLSYVSDTILRGTNAPIQFMHLDKREKSLYVVFLDVFTAIDFMEQFAHNNGLIDIGGKWCVQATYFPLYDHPPVDLYRYAKSYKASRVVVIGNVRVIQLVNFLERLSTGWHLSQIPAKDRCDQPQEILKFIGMEFGVVEKTLWLQEQNIGAIVLTSLMAAFILYNFVNEVCQTTSILKDAYAQFGVDPAISSSGRGSTPYLDAHGRVPGLAAPGDLEKKAEKQAYRRSINAIEF